MIVKNLEDITPGRAKDSHGESHTLLNDAYLIRFASHFAELGSDLQSTQLWYCNRNQNLIECIFSSL